MRVGLKACSHSVLMTLPCEPRRLSLVERQSRASCHADRSIDVSERPILCLVSPDRRHILGSRVAAVASVFSLLMANLCEATPKGLTSDQLN
jgi:hypothetical protein